MHPLRSPFRHVPLTGVIFVSTEAGKRGFSADDPAWCNLGQGQPETGELPGAPKRISTIKVHIDSLDYAPVGGLLELRQAVADFYNRHFRVGKKSQYTANNVAISAGGRLAVARAAAILGPVHVGHFLPDYTAYEELLEIFRVFTPIPILRDAKSAYRNGVDALEEEILGRGLAALLFSNPCNPTGSALIGEDLASWVRLAKKHDVALIADEFYSHYIWSDEAKDKLAVSISEYVDDVESDNVLVIDGLTKNWRYPGLRISWTLGPSAVINALGSAGSFLDGGASRPTQEAAIELLSDENAFAETAAIRRVFSKKREYMLGELASMGFHIEVPPEGGFYIWANLEGLPRALQNDMDFFYEALKRQVIVVPGHFFDVNPGGRRQSKTSRFSKHVRISFGPSMDVLQKACSRFREMIREHQK